MHFPSVFLASEPHGFGSTGFEMAREKLFCWPVPRTCLLIAVISLVGWLTLAFICLSYSAVGDEQSSKETFLELFDTSIRNQRILFFTVDPLSFYVTIKLAFSLALIMIFASGSIIVAIAWRIKYVCLVYPGLACFSGLVQIIVILCYTGHLPVPVFWYVAEVLISWCVVLLYQYYDRPEGSWKIAAAESHGIADEATAVSFHAVDEEVQAEGKEHHHHHHHHHHHKKNHNVAGADQIDVNENAMDGKPLTCE